jgi:hypothetical protein
MARRGAARPNNQNASRLLQRQELQAVNETADALTIVSLKLEEAQHRAGIAKGLVMTSFYPNADHEGAAMDAVLLLFADIDATLREARVALNGPAADASPF